MFTSNSVTIITAATGHPNLVKCLRSVQKQTWSHVEHLVVTDGPEHAEKVQKAVVAAAAATKPLHLLALPFATGKERWNGHRIYAAGSFLCNTEFVCFLDEDNWLDPDHAESLIAAASDAGSHWAFALRKIVDLQGNFITLDECESLGNLHPIFQHDQIHHIDANCYLMRRELAVLCASNWYVATRTPKKLEPDTAICRFLFQNFPKGASNRRHTVNYTVGNRPDSAQEKFFLKGNEVMRQRYPNGMPWLRP
jgi:hypothetical protein